MVTVQDYLKITGIAIFMILLITVTVRQIYKDDFDETAVKHSVITDPIFEGEVK